MFSKKQLSGFGERDSIGMAKQEGERYHACPRGNYTDREMADMIVSHLKRRLSSDPSERKIHEVIDQIAGPWKERFNPFRQDRLSQEAVGKMLGLDPCMVCLFIYGLLPREETEDIARQLEEHFGFA